MSHHRDTTLAKPDEASSTSMTCTSSRAGSTVFVMDVNSNVNGLHAEPGFHPEARYEFKVHADRADFEALAYRTGVVR